MMRFGTYAHRHVVSASAISTRPSTAAWRVLPTQSTGGVPSGAGAPATTWS